MKMLLAYIMVVMTQNREVGGSIGGVHGCKVWAKDMEVGGNVGDIHDNGTNIQGTEVGREIGDIQQLQRKPTF
jgi:hypothetical protein